MNRKIMLSLAVALGMYGQADAQKVNVPYGQFSRTPWSAKYHFGNYSDADPSADWYAAEFDDSEWEEIASPVSNCTTLPYYASSWKGSYTACWIRRHFQVEDLDNLTNIMLYVAHDDGLTLYLNGHEIYYEYDPVNALWNKNNIPMSPEMLSYLKVGDNVLAAKVTNHGGADVYVDFGMLGFEKSISEDGKFASWNFDFSEESMAGLIAYSKYIGYYNENATEFRLSWSSLNNHELYYTNDNVAKTIIPEFAGLIFNSMTDIDIPANGDDYVVLENNYDFSFTIPSLLEGQVVTIKYEPYNGYGSTTLYNNTDGMELTNGALEAQSGEVVEAQFTVGKDLDANFHFSTKTKLYSISVTTPFGSLDIIRNNANAYLSKLDGFTAIQADLKAAIDQSFLPDNASVSDIYAAIALIQETVGNTKSAMECVTLMEANIKEAEELLAVKPDETLSATVNKAKSIDNATAKSEDYISMTARLKEDILVFRTSGIAAKDFVFTTRIIADDGYVYNIDNVNHIAEFIYPSSAVSDTEFTVPSLISYNGEDYLVVSMGQNDYFSNSVVKILHLPSTLRKLGQNAFYYFSGITELDVPSTVELCEEYCFNASLLSIIRMNSESAPEVSSVTLGSDKKKIIVPDGSFHAYRVAKGWGAFVIETVNPVTVTVTNEEPGELAKRVTDAAGYVQEVNHLTVKGKMGNSDWETLKSMTNLTQVNLADAVATELPNGQFQEKWAIDRIVLPNILAIISDNAFYECGIKSITLPEDLQIIRYGAFRSCYNLESVVIPNSVTYIGGEVFSGCKNLKYVKMSDSLKSIEYFCFYGCEKLETIIWPANLETIGECSFSSCVSLKSIDLPESLLRINNYAFEYCNSLAEVVLPSKLSYLKQPFYNCNNLVKVSVRSVIPPSTDGYSPVTTNNPYDLQVFVPLWSLNDYRIAAGWSQLLNIDASGEMPQNIVIDKAFSISLSNEETADYRPTISLKPSNVAYTDDYGYSDYYFGKLTIDNDGKLAANEFQMYFSPYAKYNTDQEMFNELYNGYDKYYYSTEYNPTCLKVNGEMRAEDVKLVLTLRNMSWNFVSFPFDVMMSDIIPADANTQWVIREYSGAKRAEELMDETWVNLESSSVLKAGRGYIMHCSQPGVDVATFTLSPLKESVTRQYIFASTDRTVALEEHLSEFEHNRSWNLIGNPYPSYFDTRFLDFTSPITVWNMYQNNYLAFSPEDDKYILSPGEAFFVQRPIDSESVVFNKDGRQVNRYVRDLDYASRANAIGTARSVFNINLTDGTNVDRTRVVINENASEAYDLNRDASKFMSSNALMPQLFTVCDGVRYAINERPNGNGEVALGFRVGESGTYTISLSTDVDAEVYLEDKVTGSKVLLNANAYNFEAQAGELLDRFVLNFNLVPTGIDKVESDSSDSDNGYTLGGRKAESGHEGIVVKKNRKILTKKN